METVCSWCGRSFTNTEELVVGQRKTADDRWQVVGSFHAPCWKEYVAKHPGAQLEPEAPG